MDCIKEKKLWKMYKQTLYRGFYKSKAIMESYQKGNNTRSNFDLWNCKQENNNGYKTRRSNAGFIRRTIRGTCKITNRIRSQNSKKYK